MNKQLLKTYIDLQIEQHLTPNLIFFNQDDFNLKNFVKFCNVKHHFNVK